MTINDTDLHLRRLTKRSPANVPYLASLGKPSCIAQERWSTLVTGQKDTIRLQRKSRGSPEEGTRNNEVSNRRQAQATAITNMSTLTSFHRRGCFADGFLPAQSESLVVTAKLRRWELDGPCSIKEEESGAVQSDFHPLLLLPFLLLLDPAPKTHFLSFPSFSLHPITSCTLPSHSLLSRSRKPNRIRATCSPLPSFFSLRTSYPPPTELVP
ncbi:uncharacterized protein BDZ83DRAFT_158912 [Colletotrichum acutatum]|uniref:Uncharacterized protein n=1 Tax=Glomerella acutata TaxID=27357 RepID=A0AAD8XQ76_GLOAC|nr:uncharacterized protein BDZ83DRAFT_158912 [Colletotrichum acutatum]KAK1731418.1 hypothetical protein BDZ83DRAFT_158912 [Colletotrichum acutatum]